MSLSFAASETGQPLLAAIQMNSAADWPTNRAVLLELLQQAADAGADLVALPEFFPQLGAGLEARLALAEAAGYGPLQDLLAQAAQKHGFWLVAGSLPLKTTQPDKTTNTCLVYDPNGRQVARYDKIHLFGFQRGQERYDESEHFVAGQQPVCFDTPFARVGLGICYDLRFPELFRALDQVDLLVLPAAFTFTTGQAHWSLLLRARAVENQCYVLAPAQTGIHADGRHTWGHSLLIDPWGEELACLAEGAGLVTGHLSHQRLAEVRCQLPALAHRRLR